MLARVVFSLTLLLLGCHKKYDERIAPDSNNITKSLEGFLNIRWGESLDSAKSKMVAREGVSVDSIESPPGAYLLFMHGGEFLGCRVSQWKLLFSDRGFYRGDIEITNKLESNLSDCYEQVRKEIEKHFGAPSETSPKEYSAAWSNWTFPSESKSNVLQTLFFPDQGKVIVGFLNGERNPLRITNY